MKRMVNVCAVICIVTMVFAGKMVNVAGQIIDYPIELALVLDESDRVSDGNFENVRRGIVAFTGRFIMGDNATRMAVVMFSNEARIEVNLTANATMIQLFNRQLDSSSLRGMDEGLNLAKEQVFARDRLDTLKIAIVITNGGSSNESATVEAGKNLRENEARIFIGCVNDNGVNCSESREHFGQVTGPKRHFSILGYEVIPGYADRFVNIIACMLYEGCRFRDPERKECVAAWWLPLSIGFTCVDELGHPDADPRKNCTMDDCERQCDKWPWKSYNCSGGESEIEVDRHGPMPDGHNVFYDPMFEHCPKKKTVICPRTTDKPPTSTFVPIEESDSPGTTPASETVSGSHETAPPSETVTNNTTESVPEGVGNKPKDDAVLQGWHIGLIVLAVLLVLALIVAAVLIGARRRKHQQAAAKPAGATAAGPKGAEIISIGDKKKTTSISGAKSAGQDAAFGFDTGGEAADKSADVSLGDIHGKPAKTTSAMFGYGKQGASASIEVSLRDVARRRDKKANDSHDGGSEKGSIKEKKK